MHQLVILTSAHCRKRINSEIEAASLVLDCVLDYILDNGLHYGVRLYTTWVRLMSTAAGFEAHQLRDRGAAQGGGEPAPTPQDRHRRP